MRMARRLVAACLMALAMAATLGLDTNAAGVSSALSGSESVLQPAGGPSPSPSPCPAALPARPPPRLPTADPTRFRVRPVIDPSLALDPQLAAPAAGAGEVRVRAPSPSRRDGSGVWRRWSGRPASVRLHPTEHAAKFARFQRRHRRQFASTAEAGAAFRKFKANRERIVALNNEFRSAVLHADAPLFSSESPFADLTPEEFARQKLASEPMMLPEDHHAGNTTMMVETAAGERDAEGEHLSLLEAAFGTALDVAADGLVVDWRAQSTPVKDQQMCGGCWAFTAVATAETYLALRSRTSPKPLSTQWLLSCGGTMDAKLRGCSSGLHSMGLQFLGRQGPNLYTESEFTFRGAGVPCPGNKVQPRQAWLTRAVVNMRESAILEQLKQGPLAIGVDARSWQLYQQGILPSRVCSNSVADMKHSVTVVGFGVEKGVQYWLVRNSWGAAWGERGYIRVEAGSGACGIGNVVSWPVFQ